MRKKITRPRAYPLDPVYQNILVGRFINQVMRNGKKNTAQRVVYGAFKKIEKEQKQEPVLVFESAIKNVAPDLEVRSKRVGGANYQVPVEVRGERKITLAMRWILNAARSKKGKAMAEKLAEELVLASQNDGSAVKKRQDVQRMAEANKAFAHLIR
jgi:small subunit ribosomal protein S7